MESGNINPMTSNQLSMSQNNVIQFLYSVTIIRKLGPQWDLGIKEEMRVIRIIGSHCFNFEYLNVFLNFNMN